MSQNEKPSKDPFPWKEVLGFLGIVLAAVVGYLASTRQAEIPIEHAHTAEAKLLTQTAEVGLTPSDTPQPTFTPAPISTPSPTSTPYICPYQGLTDDETIENLIEAEAAAVNTKDLSIILKIFDPDAVFYNYETTPTTLWNGTSARYGADLFPTTDFQGAEHFDILPTGPGIDGGIAYYTSGSKGSYRISEGAWTPYFNGSLISVPSTQYGSDHWVLQKNNNGCWAIIRMEFNAGHIKFPQ